MVCLEFIDPGVTATPTTYRASSLHHWQGKHIRKTGPGNPGPLLQQHAGSSDVCYCNGQTQRLHDVSELLAPDSLGFTPNWHLACHARMQPLPMVLWIEDEDNSGHHGQRQGHLGGRYNQCSSVRCGAQVWFKGLPCKRWRRAGGYQPGMYTVTMLGRHEQPWCAKTCQLVATGHGFYRRWSAIEEGMGSWHGV